MMFKNSVKLFIANFSVFWKLLLYKIIAIGICVLLLIPTFSSWGHVLNSVDFFAGLGNFANTTMFSSVTSFFEQLFILVDTFLKAVSLLLSYNLFAFIYSTFVVLFILPFLMELSAIPTGEGIYSYMASLSKSSFVGTLIAKMGKSMLYSLLRTLCVLPFIALMGVTLYYMLSLITIDSLWAVFVPVLVIIYFSVMTALMITFFSGWMPATVVFDVSPVKGMKKGFKAVFRRFFRVFSSILMIIIITTMFTFMFTTFSLIILVPLCSVCVVMLEMVMFFESQGMRYYVDLDSIVTPKKLEQCDKFKKVKDII